MNSINPISIKDSPDHPKSLSRILKRMHRLVDALNQREVPPEISQEINQMIQQIDTGDTQPKQLKKGLFKAYRKITNLVRKELGWVPKSFYQTMWMSLGMGGFGLPIGVVIGVIMGNMGLIGLGIPIGMAIGIGIGIMMDQKAVKNGKQLDV